MTSPDNVLAYRFLTENPLGRNIPVEIVAAIDRGLGLSLCVAPGVADVSAVRDGTVAVDVPGSGFAFVAFALLEASGLQPGDYTVESLGSTPRRATALIEERCRATVLNAGNELRAEGAGCRIVSRVADIGPYLGTVVAAVASPDPEIKDLRSRSSTSCSRRHRRSSTASGSPRSSRPRCDCSNSTRPKLALTGTACSIPSGVSSPAALWTRSRSAH